MASLVQYGKYCAINTTDTEKIYFMLSFSNQKHIYNNIVKQFMGKLWMLAN